MESNGDPNLIANGSRIGLTGVSATGLASQGVAPSAGNDPAANLLAGASVLARAVREHGVVGCRAPVVFWRRLRRLRRLPGRLPLRRPSVVELLCGRGEQSGR